MRILVTGANGQLGNEMQVLAKENPQHTYYFTDVQELDICDKQAVWTYMAEKQIELVVNCAAYTAVDKAEDNQELELKENIEDGIEYDPEKDNKYLAEDEVVAEDDLKDGYVEAEEDDILLDDENDSENDELFQNLDDEDDEAIFDSDMSEDNLDD